MNNLYKINTPLKDYFLKAKSENYLKTRKDIADYYNISFSIVNNTLNGKTLNPSRKVIECLSNNLNRSPELILTDIYSHSFAEPCNDYVKTVALSLYYNFGYSLFFDSHNFFECGSLIIPYSNRIIPYFAKIRRNGPELKYTAILDWKIVRNQICYLFNNMKDYEFDKNDPTKPFNNWSSFMLAISSVLYTLLNLDCMSDFKKIIVVFYPEFPDDIYVYNQLRDNPLDTSLQILPLLYEDNAEYSIHDIDQI